MEVRYRTVKKFTRSIARNNLTAKAPKRNFLLSNRNRKFKVRFKVKFCKIKYVMYKIIVKNFLRMILQQKLKGYRKLLCKLKSKFKSNQILLWKNNLTAWHQKQKRPGRKFVLSHRNRKLYKFTSNIWFSEF